MKIKNQIINENIDTKDAELISEEWPICIPGSYSDLTFSILFDAGNFCAWILWDFSIWNRTI
jgi:hypothetical protein